MKLRPEDPMRVRAADDGASGEEDGWRGARLGAEQRARARRAAFDVQGEVAIGEPGVPRVVLAFLVVTVIATIIEFSTFGASPTTSEASQAGGAGIGVLATGAWWKLLVSNLLHGGVAHVLSNVFVIYLTGRWLEHLVGRTIVLATITWSMVLAGVGSLVVDTPSVALGASGVAFGLVGCAIAADPRAKTATGMIGRQLGLVNVVLTFAIPGISIGGHLGGLAAGLAVGALCWMRGAGSEHPAGRARVRVAPALVVASLVPIAVFAVGPSLLPGDARGFRGESTAWLLERQLSGTTLSNGLEIDHAECDPTFDELEYACEVDGDDSIVRFSERDDQWGLRTGE